MKFIKNYKSTIILLLSIILGMIVGIIFKEKASYLKPFGDLFLNLLLVIIVPLIFLTITVSIGKMKSPKRIGKILFTSLITFVVTSIISVVIGLGFAKNFNIIKYEDKNSIKEIIKEDKSVKKEKLNILEKTVNTVSTNDFKNLITNDNIIALICFSIIFGLAINLSKDKKKPVLDILDSFSSVVQKFIKIIMCYAPIGLSCYFASLVGSFGKELVLGYAKTFLIYLIACLFIYFVIYSLYAILCGGKNGFISYWKNIIPPSVCAMSTCSSAASMPINIESAKKMGVTEDVSSVSISLGTNFHKDGSIVGSVFKIMFLVQLFNSNTSTFKIILIALLATILVSAVPIGGGTISETLIITMLGFPLSVLPILTIIATIIDAPATVLNVTGNTISSVIINKFIDKKKVRDD